MEDAIRKLQVLGPASSFEPAEDVDMHGNRLAGCSHIPRDLVGAVSHATLPGGKMIPLLKTLVSSICDMDCKYCALRGGRDTKRETFTPDELAYLSQALYQQGVVKGVFLSSGLVGGGVHAQDRIIATAEIMRRKYLFPGYLHVKIMPGAERDQIAETLKWADRVSLNLESPNSNRLSELAPKKRFSIDMLQRLHWAHELRQNLEPGRRPSITTQFVVGAVNESDVELLLTSAYLRKSIGLARAYFSGFSPIPDTPLESHAPIQLRREHRLYQASFLIRDYGFDVEELPFGANGNLPLNEDPKLAWADANLQHTPIEINTADRAMLLKVPGVGPVGADRILRERRRGKLKSLSDLQKLGVLSKRAAPYILLDGIQAPRQTAFFHVIGLASY